MDLGIFSRTYPALGTDGIFTRIAADGFQAVQFNFSSAGLPSLPTEWPGAALPVVLADAARSGLTLCALSGTWNMAHPDAARRRADRDGFAHVVRAAGVMRIPLVTLCTGTRNVTDMWATHPDNASVDTWTTLRGELDAALDLADQHDVTLGIEPEPGNVVANAVLARRLLDEVDDTRLKIVLDAANLLPPEAQPRQRDVIAEAVSLLGADLALVHTKDVTASGAAVGAGRGIVDFRHFLQRIFAAGYRGPLVSHNLPAEDAPRVASYLRAVLDEVIA